MKIKLHNSLSKQFKGIEQVFIFDEKISVTHEGQYLQFRYEIDDYYFFLKFSIPNKQFEPGRQFGMKIDSKDSLWWKRWEKQGWITKEITNNEN